MVVNVIEVPGRGNFLLSDAKRESGSDFHMGKKQKGTGAPTQIATQYSTPHQCRNPAVFLVLSVSA